MYSRLVCAKIVLLTVFITLSPSLRAIAAAPSPPPLLCVGDVCNTSDSAATKSTGINWHTGHYVGLAPIMFNSSVSTATSYHMAIIDGICTNSNWEGIQLFMTWGAYEGATAGDYTQGRSIVRQYLNKLATCNKRLIISIVYGNYTGNSCNNHLPAYIINGATYGTTAGNSSGRLLCYSRFWQQATMDRYIALMQDLGTQFGDDPAFEMVFFWELLVPGVAVDQDGWSESAMATQAIRWLRASRAAMPKQQLRLGVNYWTSDSGIVSLLQACKEYSCAWGGPEVLALGAVQANQVYRGYLRNSSGAWVKTGTDFSGVIPYIGETEWKESSGTATPENLWKLANTDWTTSNGTAVLNVKPSYFVWSYNNWELALYPFKDWASSVRPFVENKIQGTINYTACPTSYSSCTTD